MPTEIMVEAREGTHILTFPISALEEIAKVNDQFEEMKQGFEFGRWRLTEVRAILDAGFRAGGSKISSAAYIEEHGVAAAVDLAYRCMALFFFQHDPGKNALGPVAQALAKTMQGNVSASTDT